MRAPLVKSILVGIVSTVADFVVLALLISGLGVSPAVANVPALLLGVTVQFFGNKYWAFEDRSADLLRQGSQFFLVECGTFLLNAGAFHLLAVVGSVPYYIARPVGELVVYLGFSYPLWSRIFGRAGRRPAATRPGASTRRDGTRGADVTRFRPPAPGGRRPPPRPCRPRS